MKLNHDKCHLLVSRHRYESVWANIGSSKIWESNDQKLLGVNIDRRIVATELYKTKENLAARIMHEIFEQRDIQYKLRSQIDFQLGSVKTVNCALRALRYLGPKIWNIVPFEIKKLRDSCIIQDENQIWETYALSL